MEAYGERFGGSSIMMPKIFVGTMYSGEAEFEESEKCVLAQQDVEITHYVISNLPEYEAHNDLWNAWNSVKMNYDLFIKVDADTIINDPRKFHAISEEFKKNPRLTGMQIPLHDYFTDAPILGLNCFSSKVVFTPAGCRLHADHADSGHDIVYRNERVEHLAPAGLHAKNPTTIQSFHFGVHRMMKNQRETMRLVKEAWYKFQDEQREWALRGAFAQRISTPLQHDYNSKEFETALNEAKSEMWKNSHKEAFDTFVRSL